MSKNPKFAPTAKKFFYQFNMRDFAKIVQNIMSSQPKEYKGKELEIARLWVHECHRVWYGDVGFLAFLPNTTHASARKE